MRIVLIAASLAALILSVSACEAMATEDECTKACEQVKGLYLGAVERESAKDEVLKGMGESGARMAEEMARLQLQYLQKECQKECNKRATQKQAQCLMAAKTTEALKDCK